jgi:hypothetical protein
MRNLFLLIVGKIILLSKVRISERNRHNPITIRTLKVWWQLILHWSIIKGVIRFPIKPNPLRGGDGKQRVFLSRDGRAAEGQIFGLRGFFVDRFDLFITVLLEEAHEETA